MKNQYNNIKKINKYVYNNNYIYYIFIYIIQAIRRARAVNALRANVGPAG